MVDVAYVDKFARIVPLDVLKDVRTLDGMLVTKRGQRLSIQPVAPKHFHAVRKLAAKM